MVSAAAESQEARQEIDEAVERYRTSVRVSERERLDSLQQVIDQANQLRRTLDALDSGTRRAIIAPVMLSRDAVDPLVLTPKLRMLIKQAEHAKRHAPRPRRGPRRHDSLRQLAAEIAILWSIENPLVKKGIKSIRGERCGLMLEFVWGELLRARVRVQSKDALGKLLYSIRAPIARKAAVERKKRLVTRTDGPVTVISRE